MHLLLFYLHSPNRLSLLALTSAREWVFTRRIVRFIKSLHDSQSPGCGVCGCWAGMIAFSWPGWVFCNKKSTNKSFLLIIFCLKFTIIYRIFNYLSIVSDTPSRNVLHRAWPQQSLHLSLYTHPLLASSHITKHIPKSLYYHQTSSSSVSIPCTPGAACPLPQSCRVQRWHTPSEDSSVRPECQSALGWSHWQGRCTHLTPTWWGWGGRIHQTPDGSPPVVGDKKVWIIAIIIILFHHFGFDGSVHYQSQKIKEYKREIILISLIPST